MNRDIKGIGVDHEARCRHYHKEVDVVAIQFPCCKEYYACFECHMELADHAPLRWPKEKWDQPAILCGRCRTTLSIQTYLATDVCPHCDHLFNEKCASHYHLYFDV